jgi:putative transposase
VRLYTSRQIRLLLENKESIGESRREWMYWMMQRAGKKNGNNKDYQFWQQHNRPIELFGREISYQKLDYIHNNPVEAGFVDKPESWQ